MAEDYVYEDSNLHHLATESLQFNDQVFSKFLEKIGNKPCEACGEQDQWVVAPDTKVTTWKSLLEWTGEVPVASICCGNCGNIRSFAWARIRYFMDKEMVKNGS